VMFIVKGVLQSKTLMTFKQYKINIGGD